MAVTTKPVSADRADRERRCSRERAAVFVHALRRHWAIALVLAAGALLRLVVMVAYDPVFWFGDTNGYLRSAELVRPGEGRPWGYPAFLWLLSHGLDHRGIVAVQPVLVLALAGAVYAFLCRRRVVPWLAALAVLPLCLSPLVANVEHHLLSDPLFLALSTVAALLLAWPEARPALWACALAGLITAAAALTRQVGLAIVPLLLVYLLFRRAGWLRVGAFAVAVAVPLAGYLVWFHETYGAYRFSNWSGKFLYARVAPIAECDRLPLTALERTLCDPRPREERPGPDGYLWRGPLPLGERRLAGLPVRRVPDEVAASFARKVITHQPLDYLGMVAGDAANVFYPGQRQRRGEACAAYWSYPDPLPRGCRTDAVWRPMWRMYPFAVDRPLAHGLHVYERVDYPIGPAMLAGLLLTLLALVWRPRRGGWRLRLDALLLALTGLGLTVAALATATFDYRYTLPLYSTVPAAAALALTQIAATRRSPQETDKAPRDAEAPSVAYATPGRNAPRRGRRQDRSALG